MNQPTSNSTPEFDWHPFTPRGVAGAARTRRWQLWVVLGITAGLSALMLVYFVVKCWAPVLREGIEQLPDGGYLRGGVYYPGETMPDRTLAENRFLSLALEWRGTAALDHTADVRIALRIDRVRFCSLFGCTGLPYQMLGDQPLGRTESGAWWRAWSPALLAALACGHVLFLVATWWVLTILYTWAIRALAFYLDREIDFGGAARVAQASLVPGALWMIAAMFSYSQSWLNLFGLVVVGVAHLPVGWVYAAAACRHLPLRPTATGVNPFEVDPPPPSPEAQPQPEAANPFQSPPAG